jgi:hypothetical protein
MAVIKKRLLDGGALLDPDASIPDLREILVDVYNDLKELRDRLVEVRTLCNEVKADHNALLSKLDADTGVADTNYASLHSTTAADVAAIGALKTSVE